MSSVGVGLVSETLDNQSVKTELPVDQTVKSALLNHPELNELLDNKRRNILYEAYLSAERYIEANDISATINELVFFRGVTNIFAGNIPLGVEQILDSNKPLLFLRRYAYYYSLSNFKPSDEFLVAISEVGKLLKDAVKNIDSDTSYLPFKSLTEFRIALNQIISLSNGFK